jgi:hypothetical protein
MDQAVITATAAKGVRSPDSVRNMQKVEGGGGAKISKELESHSVVALTSFQIIGWKNSISQRQVWGLRRSGMLPADRVAFSSKLYCRGVEDRGSYGS